MKQVIVVRTDLKMPKGKLAGQVSHASFGAIRELPNHVNDTWFNDHGQAKIILKVDNLEKIQELYDKCINYGLKPYKVLNITNDKWKDTITCMGVGPAENEVLNEIFKDLKLL